MSKVSARWVPQMLTADQKGTRLHISRYLLSCYEDDPGDLIKQVVTQAETWVHPESKCRANDGSTLAHPPKKFKRVHSAGKVMTSIFWDSQIVIMIDYLEHLRLHDKQCILCRRIEAAKPGNCKKEARKTDPVFCSCRTKPGPAHMSQVAMTAVTECGFEILPHPHILLFWLLLTSICFQN